MKARQNAWLFIFRKVLTILRQGLEQIILHCLIIVKHGTEKYQGQDPEKNQTRIWTRIGDWGQ
jgi:hypothetical protein